MDRVSDQAEAKGLTQEKLDQILTELDQEDDERPKKADSPTRDPKSPSSDTN